MADSVLFLVGASGVGKTAATRQLASAPDFLGRCRFFDTIGIPSLDDMRRNHGSGEAWQAFATDHWVETLRDEPERLVVLEGQTRPSFIREAAEKHGLQSWRVVLMDCAPEVRRERLEGRGQPELTSVRMERWAAYLRNEAESMGLPIIDTSELTVAEVVSHVRTHARQLCPECFLTSASS